MLSIDLLQLVPQLCTHASAKIIKDTGVYFPTQQCIQLSYAKEFSRFSSHSAIEITFYL